MAKKTQTQELLDKITAMENDKLIQSQAIEKLNKDLAEATRLKDVFYKASLDKEHELSQIHAVLDTVENAPPRKTKDEEYWRQVELPVMSRMFCWMAAFMAGQKKADK